MCLYPAPTLSVFICQWLLPRVHSMAARRSWRPHAVLCQRKPQCNAICVIEVSARDPLMACGLTARRSRLEQILSLDTARMGDHLAQNTGGVVVGVSGSRGQCSKSMLCLYSPWPLPKHADVWSDNPSPPTAVLGGVIPYPAVDCQTGDVYTHTTHVWPCSQDER